MGMFKSTRGRLLSWSFIVYSLLYTNLLKYSSKLNVDNKNDATIITTTNHVPLTLDGLLERLPSVDYFSCCGAGHRLSKLSDAYYLAKKIGFGLRIFFGFCNNQEVFSYFFGPPLPPEVVLEMTRAAKGTTDNLHMKVNNECPGFSRITREGPNATCKCRADRFDSDIELYAGIRERFRHKDRVERFRSEHFEGRTVIGLHLRAGNGETGDFVLKNRTIHNEDEWSRSMSKLLFSLSRNFTDPPLLFIATDTPHIVSNFKMILNDTMPVVELSQDRVGHGEGVMFGARGSVTNSGDKCLDGWSDSLSDMMLLSYTDVVVAGRPSSFTQSVPMTLSLATPKSKRKVRQSFCEVNPEATAVQCYEDLMDWCCNGVTSFSLRSIQRYDYRRMPPLEGLNLADYQTKIRKRSQTPGDCIPTPMHRRNCLPYKFPDPDSVKLTMMAERRNVKMDQWKNMVPVTAEK
jgi:hypothetical protein